MSAHLISLQELGRRFDQPQSVMRRMVEAGIIEPDFVARNHRYFKPARVAQLEKAVRTALAAEAPAIETTEPTPHEAVC